MYAHFVTGSFDGIHIPAYDPSLYGCLQPTETPSPSFPNRQKPLPQSNMVINATHAEENHNSFPIIPVAAGGVFIVILVIVTLMIVLVIVIRLVASYILYNVVLNYIGEGVKELAMVR